MSQLSDQYGLSTISPLFQERKLYVFGFPVVRSLSPTIHNTVFDALNLPWNLLPHQTSSKDDVVPLIRASSFIGASITMPLKVACIADMDGLTEEARIIGAVNTVFVRRDPTTGDRRCIGTNTDCLGVYDAIILNHPFMQNTAQGRPAIVLGGGGACRAAVYAVSKLMGASVVYLVNRDAEETEGVIEGLRSTSFRGDLVHVRSAAQAKELAPGVVVVGTVPDVEPWTEGEIEAREIMKVFLQGSEKGVLLDMCYHPLKTQLMALAEDAGWKTVPGTEALLYQGIRANLLWTEKSIEDFPIEKVRKVLEDKVKQ